ncbi:hypothetical protein [Synechococcus sp. CCY 9618]|uniref:hypothetical protein n=1 Tax=Synechococcus sp. CCY 9618 TaxID=2815602 RepID=UPI001C23668C|nr:hypothetical protein [Synechococcus sp. CCY 9618]
MTNLCFHFRLHSHHGGPDHATQSLSVDIRNDDNDRWLPLEPSLQTPGFRLYLLSLLLCQHHYLVANALERHLPLKAVDGELSVTTSSGWMIESVNGTFRVSLEPAAGEATPALDPDIIAFLERRMTVCPVSRNLPAKVTKAIAVEAALQPVLENAGLG